MANIVQALTLLLIGTLAASPLLADGDIELLCHPECRWFCNDPVCPASCQFDCSESLCQNVPCDNPSCTCENFSELQVIDCQPLNTSCPTCDIKRTGENCEDNRGRDCDCTIRCNNQPCTLTCQTPLYCPEPDCELVCERPACEEGVK